MCRFPEWSPRWKSHKSGANPLPGVAVHSIDSHPLLAIAVLPDASLAELAAINKQDQDLGADALAWCRERSELLYEIGTLKADMETLRLQMAVSGKRLLAVFCLHL